MDNPDVIFKRMKMVGGYKNFLELSKALNTSDSNISRLRKK